MSKATETTQLPLVLDGSREDRGDQRLSLRSTRKAGTCEATAPAKSSKGSSMIVRHLGTDLAGARDMRPLRENGLPPRGVTRPLTHLGPSA